MHGGNDLDGLVPASVLGEAVGLGINRVEVGVLLLCPLLPLVVVLFLPPLLLPGRLE